MESYNAEKTCLVLSVLLSRVRYLMHMYLGFRVGFIIFSIPVISDLQLMCGRFKFESSKETTKKELLLFLLLL